MQGSGRRWCRSPPGARSRRRSGARRGPARCGEERAEVVQLLHGPHAIASSEPGTSPPSRTHGRGRSRRGRRGARRPLQPRSPDRVGGVRTDDGTPPGRNARGRPTSRGHRRARRPSAAMPRSSIITGPLSSRRPASAAACRPRRGRSTCPAPWSRRPTATRSPRRGVPTPTVDASSIAASAGTMRPRNAGRSRSSVNPRNMVIDRWACALTRPASAGAPEGRPSPRSPAPARARRADVGDAAVAYREGRSVDDRVGGVDGQQYRRGHQRSTCSADTRCCERWGGSVGLTIGVTVPDHRGASTHRRNSVTGVVALSAPGSEPHDEGVSHGDDRGPQRPTDRGVLG